MQTEHFNGRGWRSVFHNPAPIIKHRAHFAEHRPANKEVAGVQRAILHQDRSHGTASFIHARFQHRACRGRIGIGSKLAQIRDQQYRFEQFFYSYFLLRGYFHKLRVAAPLRRHQAVFGKLPLHALQLRFRLVNLVDRHDDRHFCSPRVVDRFFRLRHDAVVRGHDQHHDVSDFRAACAHARKRFVTRCIHEHHGAVVDDHLVRADVLRDATRFAAGNIRFPNRVEQARFPVIDVAHHRHYWRPRLQTFLGLFLRNFQHHLFFQRDDAYHSAERFRQGRRCRHVQRLIDAGEYAAVQQILQEILGAHIQLLGKFANGDAFGNRHFARGTRLRRRDDRRSGAAARSRTLPRRMQFALTLLLAFV